MRILKTLLAALAAGAVLVSPAGALAKKPPAAKSEAKAAKQACKGLSRKHVKGEKGTPFSRCVKAAAQARKAEREQKPEAPASKAPQTEAPETEAPETEAPRTGAPETGEDRAGNGAGEAAPQP